jgi:pyridinium-3,5-biscarboxylic acid mononucleotide sulfurtransferase
VHIEQKIGRLRELLEGYGAVAVAFSGGCDSSFLARIGFETLGGNCVSLTADTFFIPRSEMMEAGKVAGEIGIRHRIVELDDFPAELLQNPENRCYLCKKIVFGELLRFAKEEGVVCLVDGTNTDDMHDFRPGLKALEELRVRSPLLEAGFSKADIREASRALGLSTWNKPAQACLASRIPFYAVEDRTPRVHPWMNEPGGGIMGGWNFAVEPIVPIDFNIM